MLYNKELKSISPFDWPSNIKITATIGPASSTVDTLERMIDNGLTVARLNFSHGSHEYHATLIRNIRQASKNKGRNVSIMLDTKGPEIRTSKLQQPSYTLLQDNKLTLSMDFDIIGTSEKIGVSHPSLYKEVKKGDMIFIDDGLIRLQVDSIDMGNKEIITTIENTAELKETKGVNVPGVDISLPVFTDKDKSDLLFGVEHNVDFIAASFVQRPEDVTHIKEFIKTKDILVYSKIESQSAVDNFDAILDKSDGIMIARGDLGIEVPLTHVIELQKRFTKKCIEKNKPVIVATQMLQSMTVNPLPTRAEVSDVYNAVLDGNDCVMLSGESASGKYPIDSVRLQCEISNVASKRDNIMKRFILVESELHCLDDYEKVVGMVKEEESSCLVITMCGKLGRWLNLVKNCYVIVVNSAEELHEVSKITIEHNDKAIKYQI